MRSLKEELDLAIEDATKPLDLLTGEVVVSRNFGSYFRSLPDCSAIRDKLRINDCGDHIRLAFLQTIHWSL